jgi:hypothetical protein
VSRRAWIVVALGVVAAAAAVGIALSEREPSAELGRRRSMTIAASIQPRSATFGDPLVAQIDLLFDRRAVDAKTIRIDAPFAPYQQVGPPLVDRKQVGNLVRVRYRYLLDCLGRACLPPASGRREFDLAAPRVFYSLKRARARASDSSEWGSVDVGPRVGEFAVQAARWRADLTPPPASYRISPGTLGALLVAAAVLLLLAAAALAAWLVVPRRPVEVVQTRPASLPLERALSGLEAAFSNGSVPEQRKALETLARELGGIDRDDLAARARHLAWSPEQPSRSAVETLVADVNGSRP